MTKVVTCPKTSKLHQPINKNTESNAQETASEVPKDNDFAEDIIDLESVEDIQSDKVDDRRQNPAGKEIGKDDLTYETENKKDESESELDFSLTDWALTIDCGHRDGYTFILCPRFHSSYSIFRLLDPSTYLLFNSFLPLSLFLYDFFLFKINV